jgi:cold shock CspA family protein
VQATVKSFDPRNGTGQVVTDDGLVLPFAAEAFATSGLIHVRPGQRMSVATLEEGPDAHITSMWLESVGFVPPRAD